MIGVIATSIYFTGAEQTLQIRQLGDELAVFGSRSDQRLGNRLEAYAYFVPVVDDHHQLGHRADQASHIVYDLRVARAKLLLHPLKPETVFGCAGNFFVKKLITSSDLHRGELQILIPLVLKTLTCPNFIYSYTLPV